MPVVIRERESSEKDPSYYLRQFSTYMGKAKGKQIWDAGRNEIAIEEFRLAWYEGVLRLMRSGDYSGLKDFSHEAMHPVSPERFLDSENFLNAEEQLWPKLRDEFVEVNSGQYMEGVFTGSIGTGKSTLALYTLAYQLYLLSCLHSPHEKFGMDSTSEILIVFQSLKLELATDVDYKRFRMIISRSPYFNTMFPFNRKLEAKMVFPNRIECRPLSGSETAALGQNVIGGLLDEMNFMEVIDKSKRAHKEGTYDQAMSLYNAITRRRKSRFMQKGKLPGILCLVSSKRYPGQFTDMKQKEAETDPTIYVFDKRTWEVQPEGRFSGEWFDLFVGSESKNPRILTPVDAKLLTPPDRALVMKVPGEYRSDFERDIMSAIRDIAGVSTIARFPFMMNFDAVGRCFGRNKSILNLEEVDFDAGTRLTFNPKRFIDKQHKRWVHIDLGVTSDAVGITCGYVDRFVKMDRGKLLEILPHINIDFILRVVPPRGGEIKFFKVRDLLFKLRENGLPITWVSFDTFQSVDSMQLLRQQNFVTGNLSTDTDAMIYETAKSALYDERVVAPLHAVCRRELQALELDPKTGKVDHPTPGSKDCADSLASVIYGLTTRREIWFAHRIPTTNIPKSLVDAMNKETSRADRRAQRT